jgi:hypothetical protein
MYSQNFVENIKQTTGADLYNTSNPESLPKSKEELINNQVMKEDGELVDDASQGQEGDGTFTDDDGMLF